MFMTLHLSIMLDFSYRNWFNFFSFIFPYSSPNQHCYLIRLWLKVFSIVQFPYQSRACYKLRLLMEHIPATVQHLVTSTPLSI
ncbi:hypothetical protein FKM82_005697 [Ascaphus truei]